MPKTDEHACRNASAAAGTVNDMWDRARSELRTLPRHRWDDYLLDFCSRLRFGTLLDPPDSDA